MHITCGFAGCVTYYDTTVNVLWERRDVFKNLRVYPDCMAILRLQHNPMLPHYGVRVQVRLIEAKKIGEWVMWRQRRGHCLLHLGTPALSTLCDPNPNPQQISGDLV